MHSVDLGFSAPTLSNARIHKSHQDPTLAVRLIHYGEHPKFYSFLQDIEFDATYTDTLSVSLSTFYLFNYPMATFARLPISLTISLSQFKSSVSFGVFNIRCVKLTCRLVTDNTTDFPAYLFSSSLDTLNFSQLHSQTNDNVSYGQSSKTCQCSKTSRAYTTPSTSHSCCPWYMEGCFTRTS